MSCSKCRLQVIPEDQIYCSSCASKYHYGCAGLAESTFRKMGRAKCETWICRACRSSADDNGEGRLLVQMKAMIDKLGNELKAQISECEKSIQFTSNQVEDVLSGFNEMKKTFKVIQQRQDELDGENQLLKKMVKELNTQVQTMEQRSLDHVLEISGIPDSVVDPHIIMESLCTKVKVPIPEINSYAIKRSTVPGILGRPKHVVVTFQSKDLRYTILKECKKAKPKVSDFTRIHTDMQPVYVNEQLSPYMKKLFYNAQKIKKEKNLAFLWVAEGKILLKKTSDGKVIQIRDDEDLKKM